MTNTHWSQNKLKNKNFKSDSQASLQDWDPDVCSGKDSCKRAPLCPIKNSDHTALWANEQQGQET